MDNQMPPTVGSDMTSNPSTVIKKKEGVKQSNKAFLLLILFFSIFLFIIFLLFMNSRNNQGDSFIRINDDEIEDETNLPTTTPTESEEDDEEEEEEVPGEFEIDVYYFNQESFDNAEEDVYDALPRTTTRLDVAAFGVEQIIEGPTASEQVSGVIPTFGIVDDGAQVEFTSTSNCDGADFKVTIVNKRATVQFCRTTFLLGDFTGGIVTGQISKTINQFTTVDMTRVLDLEGNCFGDLAGFTADECYK